MREAGRERERKGDIEKVRGRERQGKRVGEREWGREWGREGIIWRKSLSEKKIVSMLHIKK